jgi:hypothetical protein
MLYTEQIKYTNIYVFIWFIWIQADALDGGMDMFGGGEKTGDY